MPYKMLGVLMFLAMPFFAKADALYQYDKFSCLKEYGLFEHSKLSIYGQRNMPTKLGYHKSHSSKFNCKLDGEIKIKVTPELITIEHSGKTIYRGPKILDRIRVFSDPKTMHTIELCSWHSEIHGASNRPGGCLFRGFPAIKADGPNNPGKVIRILNEKYNL